MKERAKRPLFLYYMGRNNQTGMDKEAKMEKNEEVCRSIAAMGKLFVFAALFGYLFAVLDPLAAEDVLVAVAEKLSFAGKRNPFEAFLFVFFNNAAKSFMAMALGIFFGVAPAIFIFINGELLGLVFGMAQKEAGPAFLLAAIAPHGVLEIPALAIAAGYGFWLGKCLMNSLLHGVPLSGSVAFAFRGFARLVVPLLLAAAAVEIFLTPFIAALFA